MDRRTRIRALLIALLVLVAALGLQAATADPATTVRATDEAYPGNTLVTVQSYGWFDKNNGKALVVAPNGSVLWEFDPPRSRVFDGEALGDGRFLFSVATWVPDEDCPPAFRDTAVGSDHCVRNRVIEVDRGTGRVVWNYTWYDAFIHYHEVHDADRLPSGETAIVDMGNNRAFTVDRDGEITWQWRADPNIGRGSDFWEEYVPEGNAEQYRHGSPEGDWTHMNDIDRLPNGNFQLSIRNFDVVLEVDPSTNEIVDVIGRPGNHSIINEQHDPNRIGDTLLVADSKNNRVVEIDAETGADVWTYTGGPDRLQWPRDADRLPNGNTLIVDSRNFRVLEVTPDGEVVWEYSLEGERGIVYDADRLSVPEEPDDVPTGRAFDGGDGRDGALAGLVGYVESWAGFVFPPWVGFAELLTLLASALVGVWLAAEGALHWARRDGRRRD